jgi:hypothetical protein
MPDDNRISADITAAVKTQILTKVQEIRDLLPFMVNLTPEDKQSIPSIRTARAGMIEIFLPQMTANPSLVPTYVNMTNLASDRKLYGDLQDIASAVGVLFEGLTETQLVAGSDMYLAYLAYYNNVKEAARRNVPGADSLLAALAPFFARGPRPPTTPTT